MLTIRFGPLMTAEEAKKRYCPHTMNCSPCDSYKCMGDECMAWVWLENIRKGMVPHEQFMALKEAYERARADGRRLGFCCK